MKVDVKGWAIRYSSPDEPDAVGDFFLAQMTKFGHAVERGLPLPVFYQHGQDEELKDTEIGEARLEKRRKGVWAEVALDRKAHPLVADVYQLAREGQLSFSTGAAAHLVRRTRLGAHAKLVTAWPCVELSLTPTPAEVRCRAGVKALAGEMALAECEHQLSVTLVEAAARDMDHTLRRVGRRGIVSWQE